MSCLYFYFRLCSFFQNVPLTLKFDGLSRCDWGSFIVVIHFCCFWSLIHKHRASALSTPWFQWVLWWFLGFKYVFCENLSRFIKCLWLWLQPFFEDGQLVHFFIFLFNLLDDISYNLIVNWSGSFLLLLLSSLSYDRSVLAGMCTYCLKLGAFILHYNFCNIWSCSSNTSHPSHPCHVWVTCHGLIPTLNVVIKSLGFSCPKSWHFNITYILINCPHLHLSKLLIFSLFF